jgi:hypothetical protein
LCLVAAASNSVDSGLVMLFSSPSKAGYHGALRLQLLLRLLLLLLLC